MPDPIRPTDSTESSAPHEHELHALHRLAMVGTLAGGLGHDLRNIVMPVLLRLDVLGASPTIPPAARADIDAIRQSMLHLQRLAGGLRLLSSDPRERSEIQYTRLGPWWDEVCPLVVDALPANTVLVQDVDASLPDVAVPPSALAQVIMNLAMNASRAMQEVARPAFRVTAHQAGAQVRIDVSDNGVGMDAETRERCFEPFFTTRPREQSTGLGLSTGRALLKSSNGDLLVDTQNVAGATFVMVLPIHRSAPPVEGAGSRTVRFLVRDPRQLAVLRLVARQRGLRERSDGGPPPPDFIIGDALALAQLRDAPGPGGVIGASTQLIAVGSPDRTPGVLTDTPWVDARDLSSIGDLLR